MVTVMLAALFSPGKGRVEVISGKNWVEARKIWTDQGGYLAEITSEEEWMELEITIEDVCGYGVTDACHKHRK